MFSENFERTCAKSGHMGSEVLLIYIKLIVCLYVCTFLIQSQTAQLIQTKLGMVIV